MPSCLQIGGRGVLTISWAKKGATKGADSVAAAPGPVLKLFLGIA